MRVRFLNFELSRKIIIKDLIRYSEGNVTWFPDEEALGYIQEKIVEAYNYPIEDAEIRRQYKEFVETEDFGKKVEILIFSYSNSIERAILEDGTRLHFKLIPQSPEEWYCYNRELIKYYSTKFPHYSIEGLIKVFKKKQFNTPDPSRLIDSEFARIKKTINDNNPEGIPFWYNATYCGDIPRDEDGYKTLLSSHIKYGIEKFLQGKALAEYENFLKSVSQETRMDKSIINKTVSFTGYLLHDNKEKLAEQLKTSFNIEIGKSIRLMIEALKEMGLLTIENRRGKSFYNALKEYFNRNIGSYQSIFDYKLNSEIDQAENQTIRTKINYILRNLKEGE